MTIMIFNKIVQNIEAIQKPESLKEKGQNERGGERLDRHLYTNIVQSFQPKEINFKVEIFLFKWKL